MNDLVAKISSYNIFNNLVPGAIFAFLLSGLGLHTVDTKSVVVDVVIFYFFGMVLSRIGSVVLDPVLKFTGLVEFSEYSDFVKAEKDEKLLVLLETGNMYRTILAILVVCPLLVVLKKLCEAYLISETAQSMILLAALVLLFFFAYRKQNQYILKRVAHHKREGES
jgi:hypothetical protein